MPTINESGVLLLVVAFHRTACHALISYLFNCPAARTIDSITRTPEGLRFFLGEETEVKVMDAMEGMGLAQEVVCKETGPTENTKPCEAKNGYELLLEMVADVPQTRAKVCIISRVSLVDTIKKKSCACLHILVPKVG